MGKHAKIQLGPRERSDLVDSGICVFLMALYWTLIRGWLPGRSVVSVDDGMQYSYPFLHAQIAGGFGASPAIYDPTLQGGAELAGTLVYPWYLKLAIALGLSPVDSLTVVQLVPQFFLGFAGLKAIDGLLAIHVGGATSPARDSGFFVRRAAAALFVMFQPFVGSTLVTGHHLQFVPMILPLVALALLLGLRFGTVGITGLALLSLAGMGAIEDNSYQQLINAFVFGGPVVVLALWGAKSWSARQIGAALAIGLGCVLWSAAEHYEVIRHFLSSDATRAAGGREVVFSWVTAGWKDWFGSLFWNRAVFDSGRDTIFLHETNLPLGPLAVLAFAAARVFRRPILLCAGFLALLVLFCSGIEPFVSIVLGLVPPLGKFRVPMRGIWPLLHLLGVFAAAWMELQLRASPWKNKTERSNLAWVGGAAALASALLLLYPYAHEAFAWIAALVFVFAQKFPAKFRTVARFGAVAALAAASVACFHQRTPATVSLANTPDNSRQLRESILQQEPALRDPLARAAVVFEDEKFLSNTPWVIGIPTIDGYWHPQRRYVHVRTAARGSEFHEMLLNFRILPSGPGFDTIAELYNVGHVVEKVGQGTLAVRALPGEHMPAWLAGRPALADTIRAGVARFIEAGKGGAKLADRVWVMKDDVRVAPWLAQLDGLGACEGRVAGHRTRRPRFAVDFVIEPGRVPCLLTVATNYSERLFAYDDASGVQLPVLPVYGSLTGVLLAPGTRKVLLQAEPAAPAWMRLLPYLGLLLVLGTIFAASEAEVTSSPSHPLTKSNRPKAAASRRKA